MQHLVVLVLAYSDAGSTAVPCCHRDGYSGLSTSVHCVAHEVDMKADKSVSTRVSIQCSDRAATSM